MPTFGRDTIRRFANNISELKRLAARDFEDLLQVSVLLGKHKLEQIDLVSISKCAIPVFDGLLPEPHNNVIMRLLYTCTHWHALAKLRMHTDETLEIFDDVTRRLGAEFRAFVAKTCTAFDTRELARETEARKRRQQRKGATSTSESSAQSRPLPKMFNIQTYKFHALGDYPDTIRKFGTTDSFSTEPVSEYMICCFRRSRGPL